jgi:hypothetical protein
VDFEALKEHKYGVCFYCGHSWEDVLHKLEVGCRWSLEEIEQSKSDISQSVIDIRMMNEQVSAITELLETTRENHDILVFRDDAERLKRYIDIHGIAMTGRHHEEMRKKFRNI